MHRSPLPLSLAVILAAVPLDAQGPRFVYPAPPAGAVTVSSNVAYATADTTTLRMDVYRPAARGAARPVLIFLNTAFGEQRKNDFYVSWAKVAASRGLVAIVPDVRQGMQAHDYQAIIAHLAERGAQYGIDGGRIAVYAGSGNVSTALPFVQDPRQTSIRAAVMYYGSAPITEFRRDLPLLYVRAGLDRPAVNGNTPTGITGLVALAMSQNVPLTVINDAGGYHAFEIFNDDAATRDVIEQTIEFVKRATAPAYQASLRNTMAEVTAAAHVTSGNFTEAARGYAGLVAARPDDARLRLSYGEALLGDRQFAAACAEFEKLKGKGLGPRDLGLPGARACVQKGDAEAAMGFLKSIPKRFFPPQVKDEAVFAPLRERADFQALFQP